MDKKPKTQRQNLGKISKILIATLEEKEREIMKEQTSCGKIKE